MFDLQYFSNGTETEYPKPVIVKNYNEEEL
jgi:hypothetical protein